VREFYLTASEALITEGAFFHRPYGPWAEMVFSRTGNVSAVMKKMKEILDPNRVLNPGKLML
jgi:FAD/FMN-containing dehydrogenase